MKLTRVVVLTCGLVTAAAVLTSCMKPEGRNFAGSISQPAKEPYPISMVLNQVNDIPEKGNEVERAIEQYTNTRLDIQWIPSPAYDEKINVMIASGEMPNLMKVKYIPPIISAIKSDLFWEVGPLLKDFPNLSAQNEQYYRNIAVDGKIYGIPTYRDIGRAATIYRKDWMDTLGLQPPATLDEWYAVTKAMTLDDPDRNGQNDTFGLMLSRYYNQGSAAMTTRLAVSLGGVNKWGVENGRFIPEFVTEEYTGVLKLFRRLYSEKLINEDFAVTDDSEVEKVYDAGGAGLRIAVTGNAKSMQERMVKQVPGAMIDLAPMTGPKGIRVMGEAGNAGFYVIPKATVSAEADVRKILGFLDKLLDEPMSMLQIRGIEGKHFQKTAEGKTKFIDFASFQRDVKPYRDNLLNIEGYNVLPLQDTPLGEKGSRIAFENTRYAVSNPALTLDSAVYSEKGKELELMISDAQTLYIMGKIDDIGWQAEIGKWRKAGGDQMIKEYEEAYARMQSR